MLPATTLLEQHKAKFAEELWLTGLPVGTAHNCYAKKLARKVQIRPWAKVVLALIACKCAIK